MILSQLLKIGIAAVSLVGCVAAHPSLSPDEMAQHQDFVRRHTEALGRCLESREMQDLNKRMMAERVETFHQLRKKRGVQAGRRPDKNSLLKWAKVNHQKEDGHARDPESLWNFKWGEPAKPASGCILAPEADYGPFWMTGQPRLQDIRKGQKGIYMRLALHVIDLNTCKPLPSARVDAWHANAMGRYDTDANGDLRGWQPTSYQGTVEFDTIFPGHYPGRASHVHTVVKDPNDKDYAHIGQIYFDERLREKVEVTKEYKDNENEWKKNVDDPFAYEGASSRYDPFAQWAWIDDENNKEAGIIAWIAMGVNTSDVSVPQPPTKKRSLLNLHLGGEEDA